MGIPPISSSGSFFMPSQASGLVMGEAELDAILEQVFEGMSISTQAQPVSASEINRAKQEEDLNAIMGEVLGDQFDSSPEQTQLTNGKEEVPDPQIFKDELVQKLPGQMRLLLDDMLQIMDQLQQDPEILPQIVNQITNDPEFASELQAITKPGDAKAFMEDFKNWSKDLQQDPEGTIVTARAGLEMLKKGIDLKESVAEKQQKEKELGKFRMENFCKIFQKNPDFLRKQLVASFDQQQVFASERKELLNFFGIPSESQTSLVESKEWMIDMHLAELYACNQDKDMIEYIVDAEAKLDSLSSLKNLESKCPKEKFENYKKNIVTYLTQKIKK